MYARSKWLPVGIANAERLPGIKRLETWIDGIEKQEVSENKFHSSCVRVCLDDTKNLSENARRQNGPYRL